MKISTLLGGFCAVCLLSTVVLAAPAKGLAGGLYVGLDMGSIAVRTDTDHFPAALSPFVGYKLSPYIAGEASYAVLSSVNERGYAVSKNANYRINNSILAAAAVLSLPVSDAFSVQGRIGYASITSQARGVSPFPSTTTPDKPNTYGNLLLGIGARIGITKSVGMRLEYISYGALKDPASATDQVYGDPGASNLSVATIGVDYHF